MTPTAVQASTQSDELPSAHAQCGLATPATPARPVLSAATREVLLQLLGEARRLGFLGPGPIEPHLSRSLAFAVAWDRRRSSHPAHVLDLGSGGGLPGLVLGCVWPTAELVLLDANRRRTKFLESTVAALPRAGPVSVLTGRAEELAHGSLREQFDYVTARSFAPPAVTAECGAGFLACGALLSVADPPGGKTARWPEQGLSRLGLTLLGYVDAGATIASFCRTAPVDPRVPRGVGIPQKRPLWTVRPGPE